MSKEKNMKKIYSILISIVLLCSLSLTSYAAGIPMPDTSSPDYLHNVERHEEYFNNFTLPSQLTRDVTYKILDVPCYEQTEGYCGPTSCQMIIKYHTNQKIDLNILGGRLGMDSLPNGPSADGLSNLLNSYIGSNKYCYMQLPKNSTATSTLRNWTVDSINNNYPIILQTMTSSLPGYGGLNYNHYIVAKGYRFGTLGASSADIIVYNDPYKDSDTPNTYGVHEIDFSAMSSAITANTAGFVVKRTV